MHHSGPLPQTFEGPEQGFWDNTCQNGSRGKNFVSVSLNLSKNILINIVSVYFLFLFSFQFLLS